MKISKIEQIQKVLSSSGEENTHEFMVASLELNEEGMPSNLGFQFSASPITCLGMIDMLIEHLQEQKKNVYKVLKERQTSDTNGPLFGIEQDPKSEIEASKQRLKDLMDKLPPDMRKSIKKITDVLDNDLSGILKKRDQEQGSNVMDQIMKEINSRFGNEGNSYKVDND
jgi:hypothetical protein